MTRLRFCIRFYTGRMYVRPSVRPSVRHAPRARAHLRGAPAAPRGAREPRASRGALLGPIGFDWGRSGVPRGTFGKIDLFCVTVANDESADNPPPPLESCRFTRGMSGARVGTTGVPRGPGGRPGRPEVAWRSPGGRPEVPRRRSQASTVPQQPMPTLKRASFGPPRSKAF